MKQVLKDITQQTLVSVAHTMAAHMQKHKVWAFTGDLGAGKTTCIKSVCASLGVLGEVQSPTFSIVNTYLTSEGREVYHFDCYRLKHWHEALDFGIEEYLYSGEICLIEWPQVIENLLPEDLVRVHIETGENNLRTFTIEGADAWEKIQ